MIVAVSRTAFAFLALVIASVAGCVSTDAPTNEEPDAPMVDGDGASSARVYHLDAAGVLSLGAPVGDSPKRVPVASFPRTWGSEAGFPTFLTPPLDADTVIFGANVTLYAEPRGVALSTMRFVEWIAYLGPVGFANAAGVASAEDVHQAGEVREILIQIEMPHGGLALRAGEQLSLIVFPVQTQDDAADATTLDLLVDAVSTDARVVLETMSWEDTPTAPPESGSWSGRLVGSAYAGSHEGLSSETHPLAIPPASTAITVHLTVEDAAPFADLDLAVIAPDGTIFSSGTPYRVEGVRILAPNLAGLSEGEWQVRVAAYGAVVATYRVDHSASSAAPADADTLTT